MDSCPTSDGTAVAWLDTAGNPAPGPREWEACLVTLPWPPNVIEHVEVSANGVPLPVTVRRLDGYPRLYAEWPRQGPGHYVLQLRHRQEVRKDQVTIRPGKVTEADFKAILDDLENRLPTLVALGIQQAGGLVGVQLQPEPRNTVAQELARLERAIDGWGTRPGLARVLPRLAARYRTTLVNRERWTPRRRVRRLSPAGLIASIHHPSNVDKDRNLIYLRELLAERDADIYENRIVKLFVHQVSERLRALRLGIATRQSGGELAERVAQLDRRFISACQSASYLRQVTLPATPPQRVTMILMRVAEYRAAFEGLLEFQRNLTVQLDEPRLQRPLENFPALYQTWCTLHVIAHVLNEATAAGFRLEDERLVRRQTGSAYVQVLRGGVPVLRLTHPQTGVLLQVIPEPTYGTSGQLRSISFPQRPDIVVELRAPTGRRQLLLLDPKYKLDSEGDPAEGTPLKTDVDKMHAYCDAIRARDGERVVAYAATLYPGATAWFGDHLAALSATPSTIRQSLTSLEWIRRYCTP